MRDIRWLLALVVAILATGALGSLVQTQINLAVLAASGIDLSASTRLRVSLEDVLRFGPVMCGIAAAALVPALCLGHAITRTASPVRRRLVLASMGALAMWLVFWTLSRFTPMPHLVAATGSATGLALMCATALVGALLFARMAPAAAQPSSPARRLSRPAAAVWILGLLAAPAVSFYAMAPRPIEPIEAVDPASYAVETVVDRLDRPWSLAFLPDGRILITEMAGRLRAISPDGATAEIAMSALPDLFNERTVAGLMDIALDPAHSVNGLLYLTMNYGEPRANGTRLVRARLVHDRLEDLRVLFSATPKASAGNNGGRIAFLPDETLLLTIGDGQEAAAAQDLANHQGTVVRLDRDGRPALDNPYSNQPGALPELYSIGHRNPQGLAYDAITDQVLSTEHGPRGGDEINVIAGGRNHGWPLVTHGIDYSFARVSPLHEHAGFIDPLLHWTPSIAPSGLSVYQGQLFAGWHGDLLVPALKERAIRRVVRHEGQVTEQQLLLAERQERIRDVKSAPDGSIYVLTDGIAGKLLRLVPAS